MADKKPDKDRGKKPTADEQAKQQPEPLDEESLDAVLRDAPL